MIETVIFDMDGVIIDSEPIHLEIQYELFQSYDISLEPGEYQKFIGRSSKNMWQELIDRFSLTATLDEILYTDRKLYHQRLKEDPHLEPIAGVYQLIKCLKSRQVKLVLASSSSMASIRLVLQLFDLDKFFDHKISGADLQYSKPHPEIFHAAARLAQSPNQRCMVIEDSSHGVTAAKRADMWCIGYQNPNSGNQDLGLADLIIKDFHELSYYRIMEFGAD